MISEEMAHIEWQPVYIRSVWKTVFMIGVRIEWQVFQQWNVYYNYLNVFLEYYGNHMNNADLTEKNCN